MSKRVGVQEFVTNFDMFGKTLPTFNMHGKTKKQTIVGACCSILILILTFIFGILKLEHMITRKNPMMQRLTANIDTKESYSLSQDEFMMAVMIEKSGGKDIPYDSRYTRWIAEGWEYKVREDEYKITRTLMHPCTADDLSNFYTPDSAETAQKFSKFVLDGNLFCLSKKAREFEIFGSYYQPHDYNGFFIKQIPCATLVTLYDGSEVGGPDEDCVLDQQQVKAHLGNNNFQMQLYFN